MITDKQRLANIKRFAKKLSKGDDKAYKLLEEEMQPEELAWMINWLIKRVRLTEVITK